MQVYPENDAFLLAGTFLIPRIQMEESDKTMQQAMQTNPAQDGNEILPWQAGRA